MISTAYWAIRERWQAWRREDLFRRPALPESDEEFGVKFEQLCAPLRSLLHPPLPPGNF